MAFTFEQLRDAIDQLEGPPEPEARQVFWVVPTRLGVAADVRGGREVFIVGSQLRATAGIVHKHLEHGMWQGANNVTFEANRLVLPAASHFIALAALITSEMVRRGLGAETRTTQEVFSEVEPIIELSLRRGLISEEAVVGLIGELLVLDLLIESLRGRPELRSSILDMWRGHQRTSRDFLFGNTALEVKTTRLRSSIHAIHGLSQIEPRPGDGGGEDGLYLLSVGLVRADRGSLSVPVLVERIRASLGDGNPMITTPLQARFLTDVRRYGAPDGTGYDHEVMRGFPAYAIRFSTTFEPRLFDSCDSDFRVIRRRDLVGTFVSEDEISYQIVLPDEPLNEHNPASDWRSEIVALARTALGVPATGQG